MLVTFGCLIAATAATAGILLVPSEHLWKAVVLRNLVLTAMQQCAFTAKVSREEDEGM